MSSESIQGVSKVSETQSLQKTEETGADKFQTMMESTDSSIHSGIERVDVSQFVENTEAIPKEFNALEVENVTPHQAGSATDQENKRQGGGSGRDEDSVEGVSGVKETSAPSSSSNVGETSQVSKDLSVEGLTKQVEEATTKMEQVKVQLTENQTIPVKSSYEKLLRSHLVHVDDSLKIASSKVGLEYNPPAPSTDPAVNPLKKLLDLVTNSQNQMDKLHSSLGNLGPEGLTPAMGLAIQAKMGIITQQLELFSGLLNKALEATKTLMNVQV